MATCGFGELLLNAVALEFVLNLSETIYHAFLPYRKKMLVNGTYLPNSSIGGATGLIAAIACVAWSCLYVFVLQSVLPDYKWDLHSVCQPYLHDKFMHVWAGNDA